MIASFLRRHTNNMVTGIVTCGLCMALIGGLSSDVNAQDTIPAVHVLISVHEELAGDPAESALVDSVEAVVPFDREVTLRAANCVYHLIANEVSPTSTRLQCSVYRNGPNASPIFDDVRVEYGLPVVFDSIPGKGKSSYRALIRPTRADMLPSRVPTPGDSTAWHVAPGTFYEFFATPFSLAIFHAPRIKSVLESEYEQLRDTFDLKQPGRTALYFAEGGECDDFPFDMRFHSAIDPSRNRAIVRYDKMQSGVDVRVTLLTNLYRWWGYAPELLAIGAASYFDFADHDVIADRRAGQSIPLDSLVHTIEFKRHDAEVAVHHAASFVTWLIHTYGMDRFRDLYGKSTDLSLRRACWAVYQKTLAELEDDWLSYLDHRSFTSEELHEAAIRALGYHRLNRHLALLQEAVAAGDPAEPDVYYDLGLAHAQLGHWDKASEAFYWLVKRFPQDLRYATLLGEAYWSQGDWVRAALIFNGLRDNDSANGLAYLRLGDIQYDLKRVDSAVTLWRTGLSMRTAPQTQAELLLRIGRHIRHTSEDLDATPYFAEALNLSNSLLQENFGDPSVWALGGEAYMELDSLDTALRHLEQAQYLADAALDVAHIFRLLGQCYDRLGQRSEAVEEYGRVFECPATYVERRAASHFINKPYDGRWLN